MRLFVALYPEAEVRERIARKAREALSRERISANARFSPADNLHVTLQFLGEVDSTRVPSIQAALDRTARTASSFDVCHKGLGSFPGAFWIGVDRDSGKALSFLASLVQGELAAEGFPREARPFRPHMTIARLGGTDRRKTLPAHTISEYEEEFPSFSWNAREIALMESRTLPEGAQYRVIFAVSLQAG